MPRYRIVRMQNERSATKFEFDAADDEEAFRLLHDESELDALLDSSGDSDAIEPDVYDEIRGLDRLEDGAFVMLARISHEGRRIGGLNQRKFFCQKGIS